MPDVQELHDKYGAFTHILKDFRDNHGLSGAVYTQITDVEKESNGLMTYDRILKVDPAKIRLANSFNYPITAYNPVVPTSERRNQNYQYTLEKPANSWFARDFAATDWKTAPGGFGTAVTTGAGKVGTEWNSSEIWLRRNFTLPNLSAEQVKQLVLTNFHDEDVEVYINGVLAYQATGFVTRYEQAPLSDAARGFNYGRQKRVRDSLQADARRAICGCRFVAENCGKISVESDEKRQ